QQVGRRASVALAEHQSFLHEVLFVGGDAPRQVSRSRGVMMCSVLYAEDGFYGQMTKLPDVPGPFLLHQAMADCGAYLGDWSLKPGAGVLDEVAEQRKDIASPLAQG